jgi:hypothetical protein
MRIVLKNHDEAAHVWAQQLQHEGRASNVFFYGKTIYSYGEHFPLAKFEKKNVVLMNSNRYSVSTSKHQAIVSRALDRDTVKVFHVPYPGSQREKPYHFGNVESYFNDFKKHLDKASRARSNYSYHLKWAKDSRENALQYCKEFRCKKHFNGFDFDFDFDSDSVKEKVSKIREREKKNEQQKIARQKKALEEGVIKWRKGENVLIHHYPETLLRLDGETVETSRRAYFPLEDAKRAIRFVKAIVKKGEPWKRNGERFKIGIYQLDTVSACGDVKAGCHRVKFEEIERLNDAIQLF